MKMINKMLKLIACSVIVQNNYVSEKNGDEHISVSK